MAQEIEGTLLEIDDRPKISVSCEMKVNLGNYESAGGSCVLSGLREDVTGAEIDRLLDTAQMTFDLIRERVEQRLTEYRQEKSGSKLANRV